MGRNDLYITVPSLFRCPISLDVMKSPVSLCTGVTYDRSSIQRWLESGNNTCPATMQVLHTKDFVPNHTLRRLIQIWSDSVRTGGATTDSDSVVVLTHDQARGLAEQIKNSKINDSCLQSMSKLASYAAEAAENRTILASIDGFVPSVIEIVTNIPKDGTNTNEDDEFRFAKVIQLCVLIFEHYKDKKNLEKLMANKECVESMVSLLQKGSIESRIATARVLEMIAIDVETKFFLAENVELLSELVNLLNVDLGLNAVEAGLSSLMCIFQPKRNRVKLVGIGIVKWLAKLLSNSNSKSSAVLIEKVLKLLEMVLCCKEGRNEVCEDQICIAAIVKKVLKVSNEATEHAVTILWSLCWLFRDLRAQEAVTRSNGLGKVLLLMQSNCSPAVRQMSRDLLKIFRVDSKSCVSSYETKTTHIMPF